MARQANELAATLTGARRALDDPARTDWAYFPAEHPGASFGGFDTGERIALFRLLGTSMSLAGLAKVSSIMALEPVLDHLEHSGMKPYRDVGRYSFSVWGEPGDVGAWAWRFEGHHVSVHVTMLEGEVVGTTPFFLGANPALVEAGGHVVTRPCGAEEDAGRTVLAGLDADQRARAVLHPEAPPDIVLGNRPEVPREADGGDFVSPVQGLWRGTDGAHLRAVHFDADAPRGIPAADLDGRQRRTLAELIDVYLDRLAPELAAPERRRFDAAGGVDGLWFAWAGSDRTREAHYYRVQGPSMVIEYDDAQDGANHVHAVWRDPARDFGRDPLRAHLASGH
jgi:hypothetical protein